MSTFEFLHHLSFQPLAEVMEGLHQSGRSKRIDMSKDNQELMQLDLSDTVGFSTWMEQQLQGKVGWGGYLEHREMYRRSRHFDGDGEPRSIHLGIDVWASVNKPVFTPLEGTIHSFGDNAGFGNYGPTLILQHEISGNLFFTLYGHLSTTDFKQWKAGRIVKAGEKIGHLGKAEENGNWPPHLHFQVMTDLLGMRGDFPGVAKPSEKRFYAGICADPNLLLRIPV